MLAISCNSCDLYRFGKGVQSDFKNNFSKKKTFFQSYSFIGNIIAKKYCEKCSIDINRYSLTIKFHTADNNLHFGFPPYFDFTNNDILVLSVSEKIFSSVKENDLIIKKNNVNTVEVNDTIFFLLSDKDLQWLPNK